MVNTLNVPVNMIEKEKELIMLRNKIAIMESRLSYYDKRFVEIKEGIMKNNNEFDFVNNTFNEEKDVCESKELGENNEE